MYTKTKISEIYLMALLRNKEQLGYLILYNNYAKALYTVLIKIVRSDSIAADLLQDSFVKIWRNLDYYDAPKASLFTWMLNITRNLGIDELRSGTYKKSLLNIELEAHINKIDMEHTIETNVDILGVQVIVDKLQPMYQQIIDLIYYRGYTNLRFQKNLIFHWGQ